MDFRDKTKDELIYELQKLQHEFDSFKTSCKNNITEYKLNEKTLENIEGQFRSIFENSSEAILFTNPDGSVYAANPEACRIFNMSEDEICKLGRNGIVDSDDLRLIHALDEREKTGKFKGELNLLRKDGTKFPADITSIVFRDTSGNERTSMIIREITEGNLAERTLLAIKEQFSALSESALVGIYVIKDGKYAYVNPAMARIFGYSVAEMTGISPLEAVQASDHEMVVENVRRRISGEVKAMQYEARGRHKDGSTRDVEVYGSRMEMDGRPVLIGTLIDITERKNAEENLKKITEYLQTLNHYLNEVRENERALISREIHDELGQSLTALKIDIDWLRGQVARDSEPGTKLKGMTELITTTIRDVQRISSDLHPALLDDLGLTATLAWYTEEFQKRTGITVNLKIIKDTNLSKKIGIVIFRIVQESLTNIARHSGAERAEIKMKKKRNNLILDISDNGTGITENEMHSSRSLGLLNMKERAREIGGSLTIDSVPDGGTKIELIIPDALKQGKVVS